MKFYAVFDENGESVSTSQQREEAAFQEQRQQIRLALSMGNDDAEPLYQMRDGNRNDDKDELRAARRLNEIDQPTGIVAIGDGARFALDSLRQLALLNARDLADGSYRRRIDLVLIAPTLATNAFGASTNPLADGHLAAKVCRRVVVLHSDGNWPAHGRDDLNGQLGHWGPSGPCLDNVICLDVSAQILPYLSGVKAFTESLELWGLVGRCLNGTHATALQRYAERGRTP